MKLTVGLPWDIPWGILSDATASKFLVEFSLWDKQISTWNIPLDRPISRTWIPGACIIAHGVGFTTANHKFPWEYPIMVPGSFHGIYHDNLCEIPMGPTTTWYPDVLVSSAKTTHVRIRIPIIYDTATSIEHAA